MSTTRIRPVSVPPMETRFVTRGTGEKRYHKDRATAQRRRQDESSVAEALAWMELHEAEVEADPADDLDEWQNNAFRDDDQPDEGPIRTGWATVLPDHDVLDWYADLHEVDSPWATLTDEDLRGLTVTQMFWGDYTTDDREV